MTGSVGCMRRVTVNVVEMRPVITAESPGACIVTVATMAATAVTGATVNTRMPTRFPWTVIDD